MSHTSDRVETANVDVKSAAARLKLLIFAFNSRVLYSLPPDDPPETGKSLDFLNHLWAAPATCLAKTESREAHGTSGIVL